LGWHEISSVIAKVFLQNGWGHVEMTTRISDAQNYSE